jgi:cyclopropane-fatty-acyl-phospholipid synthase
VRLNTKYGSRKNILEHYDIGNDFYKLWLDPTMTYSSAICQNSNETLEQAQINKYKRIIDVLDVGGAKVLEIGSGWGGFATQASQAGAQVTGITISDQQYDFSTQKLEGRAQVLKQDYRDIQGVYDRIVSIEMFEAVGEKYWPLYFQKIRNSLVKGGRALIQTITIADDVFHTYRKSSDYIRHYVFPGGMLPSKSQFIHQVHRAGMDIGDVFEFGQDYAWTLKEWNTNFMRIKDTLLTMDYSPQFLKAWEFYLNLCIAGFQAKRTNVMQIEIVH